MIPYGRQEISQADIDAVVEVLRGDRLTQGPAVPAFERAVAEHCGATHGVAANSGTSALHVACLALGVGPGDVVWTSPNTFVASANCARYCGAGVDFVDIDPQTWCMSVEALRLKLSTAGQLPKVVIPVHFAGQSCDMAAIAALATQYGFRVIEDATHALGGMYDNDPVGGCRYSDIVVFSFHPVKIITTGEGGMAVTNDGEIVNRMRRLTSHGVTRDAGEMKRQPDGPWYYEQVELGFNYRMTDIQAALGLSQLSRLDAWVKRRNELADRYEAAFGALPMKCQRVPDSVRSARHLFVIRVAAEWRRTMFDRLREAGIGVNVHYIPVHLQPDYGRLGLGEGRFSEAEQHYREAISLPMFSGLTDEQHAYVVDNVRQALDGETRSAGR